MDRRPHDRLREPIALVSEKAMGFAGDQPTLRAYAMGFARAQPIPPTRVNPPHNHWPPNRYSRLSTWLPMKAQTPCETSLPGRAAVMGGARHSAWIVKSP